MTRSSYGLKVVAELVNVRPTEIRSFLQGRLSASRALELDQRAHLNRNLRF
jgi:hypothetical protein